VHIYSIDGIDAQYGPLIMIGDNSIVGAGTVVRGNVPDNSALVGNPARVICSTEYYVNKYKGMIENAKEIYDDNSLEDLRTAKNLEGMRKGFIL
jgi:carbonic anhydrase/acetyltransferase-like protein (isoleucine patch superfamily)